MCFFMEAFGTDDGYQFEEKQWQREEIALSVRVFAGEGDLRQEAERLGVDDSDYLHAFTAAGREESVCTIHVLDPDSNPWKPGIIGHEVAHCIWGEFHPSQPYAESGMIGNPGAASER